MRFKDLRKKLAEALLPTDTYGGYVAGTKVGSMDTQDNAVDNVNASVHQLSQRELQRLNTFVGALEAKCYIDPNTAINQMKQKLFTQGISFDFNQEAMLEDGVHAFPLKQFGGREGMDGTSYTPIRYVRRPNDERNAPAESNKNAAHSTETQSEVGPSDGYGDYDGYGYYEGCGGCGDYDDGCDDSDSDSGGTAARAEEGCKRYPASTPHNARHEPR